MDAETLRAFALTLPMVTEGFPFGNDALVLKANGKMFLLIALDELPLKISLKGNPDDNVQLREAYPESCSGAYHMNKIHWNSIVIDGRMTQKLIEELIAKSHQLVYKEPKKK